MLNDMFCSVPFKKKYVTLDEEQMHKVFSNCYLVYFEQYLYVLQKIILENQVLLMYVKQNMVAISLGLKFFKFICHGCRLLNSL